jgi:tetratricopeptide (TPR) repeat protein
MTGTQIYIAYAREDAPRVRRLYSGLCERGLQVWLDERSLHPGRWRRQLERAISQSRWFLLCLSGAALGKIAGGKSALSDEFTTAWEIAKGQPEGHFTIIPLRLEPCGRGDLIVSSFHQYDLFPEELFTRRLDELAKRLTSTGTDEDSDVRGGSHVLDVLATCEAHLYVGEYDFALAAAEKVVELAPEEPQGYHARACAKEGKGEVDRAIEDYSRAIQLDSGYAIAYNNRGLAYTRNEAHAAALVDFDTAIALNPTAAIPYNNRGLVRKQMNDLDGALHDYGEALRLDPYYVGCYLNRAITLWLRENRNAALEDLAEAIRLAPQEDGAYKLRGEMRWVLRDLTGAISDYSEVIRLAPQQRDGYFKRGVAREDAGDFAGAMQDYDEALRLLPTAVGYFNRALLHKRRKNWTAAIRDLERAVDLDPSDEEARSTLEVCRFNLRFGGTP